MNADPQGASHPPLTRSRLDRLRGWAAQMLGGPKSAIPQGQGPTPPQATTWPQQPEPLSAADRQFLLQLARQALADAVADGPPLKPHDLPPQLTEKRGCFVTLSHAGELRGCVGHVLPETPLYQAVIESACGAATRDPRFQPIQADQVSELKIQISVLTQPHLLQFVTTEELLQQLHPHEDGVLLEIEGHIATFLPQVWEQLPDKLEFLDRLAQKAGYPPGAWQRKGVSLSIYHTESFAEN